MNEDKIDELESRIETLENKVDMLWWEILKIVLGMSLGALIISVITSLI
jgi:tetrahydromethanopterin S-methyltransferase subunit G